MDDSSSSARNLTRRTLLRSVPAGLALGSVVGNVSAESSRWTRTLMGGTDQETQLHVYDSGTPGLTAFVVVGVHGDEEAGWKAAEDLTTWTVDTGRLVILPKANIVGVRNLTRDGPNRDLNRMFPLDEVGDTELARQIWDAVLDFHPDLVVDLHESKGLYGDGGLGQSLAYAPVTNPGDAAGAAIDAVNETVMRDEWDFGRRLLPSPVESPMGVLVQKAAYELGVSTFIVETWEDLDLTKRVRWQKKVVQRLLSHRAETYTPPTSWQELRVGGTGPTTRFAFEAGSEVRATDTLESSDTVSKYSVEGQVSTQDDYYDFTGEVTSFVVTEGDDSDLIVEIDDAERSVAQLNG